MRRTSRRRGIRLSQAGAEQGNHGEASAAKGIGTQVQDRTQGKRRKSGREDGRDAQQRRHDGASTQAGVDTVPVGGQIDGTRTESIDPQHKGRETGQTTWIGDGAAHGAGNPNGSRPEAATPDVR